MQFAFIAAAIPTRYVNSVYIAPTIAVFDTFCASCKATRQNAMTVKKSKRSITSYNIVHMMAVAFFAIPNIDMNYMMNSGAFTTNYPMQNVCHATLKKGDVASYALKNVVLYMKFTKIGVNAAIKGTSKYQIDPRYSGMV